VQWPIPIMERVWPFGNFTEREGGGGFSAEKRRGSWHMWALAPLSTTQSWWWSKEEGEEVTLPTKLEEVGVGLSRSSSFW
jgi:hypothetical protein